MVKFSHAPMLQAKLLTHQEKSCMGVGHIRWKFDYDSFLRYPNILYSIKIRIKQKSITMFKVPFMLEMNCYLLHFIRRKKERFSKSTKRIHNFANVENMAQTIFLRQLEYT